MLDDREKAPVFIAEGQLRVRVPWRGNIGHGKQAPGKRFAHLRWIVVHGLEIDPGHPGQPAARSRAIEDYPPGRLRRAQRPVPAVPEREGLGAERTPPPPGPERPGGRPDLSSTRRAWRRGRASAARSGHRVPDGTPRPGTCACPRRRTPASPAAGRDGLQLADRARAAPGKLPGLVRTPVENLAEPVSANSRVHVPRAFPAGPGSPPPHGASCPDTCSSLRSRPCRSLIQAVRPEGRGLAGGRGSP